MRSPKVLVLYNEPVLPVGHRDAESEHEVLGTVEIVSRNLTQAGFEVIRLGMNHDPNALLTGLRDQHPVVVFNLFEGTGDDSRNEAFVAGLLEWLDIPFTGCPFHTLALARCKHLAKTLLRGAGLPTPEYFVVDELPVADCTLEWPVIVKPATQDGSIGLDQGSVVTDQRRLNERVAYLLKNYGPPVLVEEYIRGRELSVSLIETPTLRVLPVSEVLFTDKDPDYWPIVTYDAKWKPGSHEYEATPPRYPADVSPKLAERLSAIAIQAFRLLGCRDYARVDFRVRPNGKAYILEVNPNPDFSPDAGLTGVLASAGLTHPQFTVDLVKSALARGWKPTSIRAKKQAEMKIRPYRGEDRDALRKIIESCGAFDSQGLEATLAHAEDTLAKNEHSEYDFMISEQDKKVSAYACYGKVLRTGGAYQLHWIAVAPAHQGQGLGYQLLRRVEAKVLTAGGRVLIAETASQPSHAQARQFFLRQGFRLVGDVPDFYCDGKSRLSYAKYLAIAH